MIPIFDGNDLFASCVLTEAYFFEDKGDSYNVQLGIKIDYRTEKKHFGMIGQKSIMKNTGESK